MSTLISPSTSKYLASRSTPRTTRALNSVLVSFFKHLPRRNILSHSNGIQHVATASCGLYNNIYHDILFQTCLICFERTLRLISTIVQDCRTRDCQNVVGFWEINARLVSSTSVYLYVHVVLCTKRLRCCFVMYKTDSMLFCYV